ncbi:non-ribosomal peptide synthetase [Streptomyces hirsutus]|uniref:non-ribosomal peptide synthetase n=1 Tax=Streptomyces hirsutus TaxID=35620 RepID=UPI0012FED3FA|nr:non-ribosomal peptide synthetase [Streptomyces hirsutus]
MPSAAAGERVASVVDAVRETFGGRAPATGEPVLPPGADSMTALALALALEDRLGVAVPPSLLRDGHDAAALAERLAGEHDTAAPGRRLTPAAGPAGLEPFSPTALQQAYLAGKEEELTPDAVGCHHYREFTVPDLDADRLRAAWSAVRQRHTMLRCALTPDGRLRIRPARDTAVPVHPAGHDPAEVRARLSRRRYTADDWPLHELEVTRLPDGDAVLHLAVDGLLCDGRALLVVMRDLWRAYEDSPEALTPEPDEVSFPAFAAAVAKEAAGERYAEDLRHWEARLADLPPGPGIVDPPARRDGDFGGGPDRLPLAGTLGAADWAALREVAARRGVTPTALLLSEFVAVLTDAGARLPFSLVLTTGDRARTRGAENTVGTFTSTLVFPVADTDAVAVQRCLAEDLDHATVPGVAALRRRRGPVPELPVVFTGMLDDERPPGGFPERYAVGRTSGVALDHQVWEANGTLHYRWDVVERAFPGPGARALFDAYGARLRALTGATEPVEQMEVEVERPLDDLQEAYLVARALGDEDVGGCRMLLGYEVEDLDVSRLRDAEARLIARHPVLRARVDAEHGLRLPSRTASVAAPEVPEVPLTPELREELLRQPFPLGVGHLDVRVGRGEDGPDVVLLTVDLALIDARSIHLVGRELMRLYAGGDDPGTAPPSRSAGTATALDPHEAGEHWRRRVAALSPGPRLPAAADDGTRRRLRGTLPGWDTVVAAAAEHGCTPDGLLLAAYARALSPGLGDVFTVPVVRWPDGTDAARPAELTALSWVTVTAEGCPLLDLARRYDAVLAEDRAADAIRGLTELRRSRRTDSSLPVVYTSLFDLDAHPLPDGVTAGAWVTSTPGVALDCVAVQEGGVLEYAWDALPEQLPADWLEDAFSRFAADLAGLASLAGTPADDPELPPSRWNDTTRPFPADLPVQILIEDQARLRPADVALRWSSGALSFAELELRANRLAWTLLDAGVGRGDVVGVSVRRGPDMVVAVLGILKAGGAYLPVLPSLPRDRAAVMLGDAAAAFLISDVSCGWAASVPDVRPVDLDAVLARPHPREATAPEPVNDVDDLAYVIFTSGSTGRPKGVGITHRPMLNLFEWARRTFGFGPGDLGLCVTSLGFDLSVFDIFGLLGLGAALYVADEEQQRDPRLLLQVLRTEPVTFWNSAPTTLANLVPEFDGPAGLPGGDALRLVFLSGDYTPLWLPDRLRAAFPAATLVSLGGATEATVWSNYFVVDRVDPAWRSIPYGRPIDNSRYYVLDERRRPVPIGTEGELYIAGECLAVGYYRQPELTAERFVTGDFPELPGPPETRMYATGDRARYGADGLLHFLGRQDGQVKVRGFRVELPEIEHRLRGHPGVADAVVLLRTGSGGEGRLVAYVLPDGPPPTAEELRAHVAAALPDYMVPGVVGFVTQWPATANGKLDRDALPWPVHGPGVTPVAARPAPLPPPAPADAEVRTGPEVPPAGDVVEEIGVLFGELLDLPPVDPGADLWDLGATSFTMVRAGRVLRERYGRDVPVSVLLAEPTVRAIAARMSGAVPPGAEAADAAAPPRTEAAVGGAAGSPVAAPPPPEPVAEPPRVDFFAAEDRRRFKEGGHGQRPLSGPARPLSGDRPSEGQRRWRASRRPTAGRRLDGARLGDLLRVLARTGERAEDGALYPSAGDTYAVQVYVLVRDGAVDGLEAGAYYYRPRTHVLEPLGTGADVPVAAHVFYNRPFAARAAAEIYLVGETRGIEPLYGDQAPRYLALEAGHMAQLLMQQQVPSGVAVCPVGDLRQSDLAKALGLGPSHTFLLGMLCAPLEAADDGDPGEPLWTAASAPAVPRTAEIAVVGMAGRFPGAAGPDALWRLLSEGRSALRPLPPARAAALGWTGPPVIGGFLDPTGPVDLRPLRVSPAEADVLDPQLRLLLPTVWQCLELAGHTPRSLTEGGGRVGVFVASMWDDHLTTAGDGWERGGAVEVVATRATTPNRLSHAFGWQGPSLAVDTACSSSLTALHLAMNALRAGECDSAVVAGVNLVTHRRHLGLLAGLGLLAAPEDGRPGGAYDEAAPGWYVGEAVGALLLRRADTAARDGDPVHGILETSWSAHAGGEGRFGAPGPEPLTASLRRMLSEAGLDPATVSYVESAAAGAGLADAAEFAAFAELLADRGRPVPMGTLKPNVGHSEGASGIGQVMKVMLQLRHGRIAPTLVSELPSPLVDWDDKNLFVPRRAMDWEAAHGPRRAVVNAVGSGGSYGHVVVRDPEGTR